MRWTGVSECFGGEGGSEDWKAGGENRNIGDWLRPQDTRVFGMCITRMHWHNCRGIFAKEEMNDWASIMRP